MFPGKLITKIPIPTFTKSSEKVGMCILVIDFPGNIFMSSDGFQNLLWSKKNEQKRNGVTELRGQADIHFDNTHGCNRNRKILLTKSPEYSTCKHSYCIVNCYL